MKAQDTTKPINLLQRWKDFNLNMMPIDELDIRILNALNKNCRDSNIRIAKKLRVSEATVRRRIRLMEEKGLLLGYSVLINYALIEDPVKTYISLKVEKEHENKVIERLCQHLCSLAVYSVTGEDDILAVMFFETVLKYTEFMEQFKKMKGVKHSTVQTVISSYKGRIWTGV